MSLRTLIRPRAGHLGRSRADRLRRSRADRPRRPRAGHLRLLAAALSLFALGAGGWLWLRDSSLVRVEDVEITGVTASDGDHVRAALDEAGREQTTLHVRMAALRAAVRAYASVADLRVRADFPHTLRIEVIEHRPVAALVVGDSRVPVTGSGLLLTGVQADADLPDLRPARPPVGDRVDDPRARAALAVAGRGSRRAPRTAHRSRGPRPPRTRARPR
jgi:cell division protein FtsQ